MNNQDTARQELISSFESLFNPQSVVVIGASSLPGKWGFILPINLMSNNYAGRIHMVNHNAKWVLGHRAYKSILDVEDDQIDLVLVAVPAPAVPDVIRDCGKKRVKNAVVISANFKETGEQGEALQQELVDLAAEHNIRIIGPNCMGICSPGNNLFALGAPTAPPAGKIAFVSQSGNLGIQLLGWADHAGMGISRFISSGNEAVTKSHEILEFYGADPQTSVIIMYIEGITDGGKFLEVARRVSRKKPVIVFKIGKTEAGAKAAMSHSASVAGSHDVFEAAVKQAGLIEVESTEELVDMARTMSELPLPKSDRVAVMTLGGGWGVVAADQCAAKGLTLPDLPESCMGQINESLPDFWSRNNPVDLVGSIRRANHYKVLEVLSKDDSFDSVITLGSLMGGKFDRASGFSALKDFMKRMHRNQGMRTYLLAYQVIKGWYQLGKEAKQAGLTGKKQADQSRSDRLDPAEAKEWSAEAFTKVVKKIMKKSGKPVIPVSIDAFNLAEFYKDYGLVAFGVPERAVNVLAGMVQYVKYLNRRDAEDAAEDQDDFSPDTEKAEQIFGEAGPVLSEHQSKQLLECFGIDTVNEKAASDKDQALAAAREIGYPVALKIDSPDILHKTEAQVVQLDISDDEQLIQAYEQIQNAAREHNPKAKINGVLVQQMAKHGVEVMIGSTLDPQFGQTMVFGLGGIFVEALGDVALRVVPLTRFDAASMIDDIRGKKVLMGFRGAPAADLDALAQAIHRTGLLVNHFKDRIREMDINPILAGPNNAMALDALIVKNMKNF